MGRDPLEQQSTLDERNTRGAPVDTAGPDDGGATARTRVSAGDANDANASALATSSSNAIAGTSGVASGAVTLTLAKSPTKARS